MKLTKEEFYKDSASQGIWFYKSREFTEKEIDEILQNQEDAEKRRELICPRCDGYIDAVANSVHLIVCENGHEFDDTNKIIVERLKKLRDDLEKYRICEDEDIAISLDAQISEINKVLGEKE
ncbi:MAG: hypothetical protein ACRENO_08280 [Thermodesulfobacteriota bacterium]